MRGLGSVQVDPSCVYIFSIAGERVGFLANNCGQIYPYFTQKIPKLVNKSGVCDLQIYPCRYLLEVGCCNIFAVNLNVPSEFL